MTESVSAVRESSKTKNNVSGNLVSGVGLVKYTSQTTTTTRTTITARTDASSTGTFTSKKALDSGYNYTLTCQMFMNGTIGYSASGTGWAYWGTKSLTITNSTGTSGRFTSTISTIINSPYADTLTAKLKNTGAGAGTSAQVDAELNRTTVNQKTETVTTSIV